MKARTKRNKILLGVVGTLAVMAGTVAVTGVAEADPTAQGNTGWTCKTPNNTNGSWETRCTHKNGHKFGATFQNTGGSGEQKLYVEDHFANGAPTVVRLWFTGGDPAVYTSSDDLNYTAGKKIHMKVCSSFSSGAACWSRTGTT